MSEERPSVIILAGPNGAGKSTTAPALLKGTLEVTEFVNADTIALGLSGFEPEGAGVAAGRVMLARIRELAAGRVSFAFETTLASRLFAPRIADLIKSGFTFHLLFLWLPSADFAVVRVADRVRAGGHSVPDQTVRRRYETGLRNFFSLYRPLAATWRMYDNSTSGGPELIAAGEGTTTTLVADRRIWEQIRLGYSDESQEE